MNTAPLPPEPIEVFALALKELRAAQEWEIDHQGVQLVVTTDRRQVYDSFDIYLSGSSAPQWCVWRDTSGGFTIGNGNAEELDQAFATLADALEFISIRLGHCE